MDQLYESVQHFTSGAVGGAALVVVGQPFDTVKVKMQTFPHTFDTPLRCLMLTLQNEGALRGLYAGSVPSFYANVTENAVLFLCYEHCKHVVSMLSGDGNVVLQKAVAGSGAAGISAIFLCPFELLKCRMQAQQQLLDRVSEMAGQPVRAKRYVVIWQLSRLHQIISQFCQNRFSAKAHWLAHLPLVFPMLSSLNLA